MSADTSFAPPVALDAIFRRNAQTNPNAAAAIEMNGVQPRSFTYAELDSMADAVASQIAGFQLDAPRNIALLLPNGIELVAALLAVMRAGHCGVPLPVLWRKSDLARALRHCEASALLTTSRFEHEDLPALAVAAAGDVFELSFPCAFGENLPDGILPLSLTQTGDMKMSQQIAFREHPVIATFAAKPDGIDLVPRTDAQWLAAGLSPLLAADIRQGDAIFSAVSFASLAGLAGGFVPWLLTGGTLYLCADLPREAMTVSSGRLHLLANARALPAVASILGAGFASCTGVQTGNAQADYSNVRSERTADFYSFGQHAAFAVGRSGPVQPAAIPLGEFAVGGNGGPVTMEISLDKTDNVLVRGPAASGGDWVSTGFKAHKIAEDFFEPLAPEGILTIGSLQFGEEDLERRILGAVPDAKIALTADPLLGTRIVIWSAQPDHAVRSLLDAGLPRIIAHSVLESERTRAAG